MTMELPLPMAEDALRVIYELQFVGRPQAFPRPEKSSQNRATLVKTGRQTYFETVPILAVLAEFYTSEKPSYVDYRDLSVAVTYLHRRGLIELVEIKDGDACTWPGAHCDVELAIGCYFRPDGAGVAHWWDPFGKISEIPARFFMASEKLIKEEYSWHGRIVMTGIMVDGHHLFWRFSRTHQRGFYSHPDDPAFTLNYPAAMSGFPRNKNYVLTSAGMKLIEPTISGEPHSHDPPDTGKPGVASKSGKPKLQRLEWLTKAMLTVQAHPDWSNNRIAKHVGVASSTLSRNSTYKTAAAMARGVKSDVQPGFLKTDDEAHFSDVDGVTPQESSDDIDD